MNRLAKNYNHNNKAYKKIKVIYNHLQQSDTDQIIEFGLHEFLTKFIDDISVVYDDLETAYFLGTNK